MSTGEDCEPPRSDAERFSALWEQYAGRVQAYALRHVDAHVAQEVVAETFLVAWRRLADVPGDPLPWLLVVARNTIANQRRSTYRARALERELARVAHLAGAGASADMPVLNREEMLGALARLSARDREAVLLVAWDGLSPAQAATVLGVTVPTFQMRLSRARQRLARAMEEPGARPQPSREIPLTRTLRSDR